MVKTYGKNFYLSESQANCRISIFRITKIFSIEMHKVISMDQYMQRQLLKTHFMLDTFDTMGQNKNHTQCINSMFEVRRKMRHIESKRYVKQGRYSIQDFTNLWWNIDSTQWLSWFSILPKFHFQWSRNRCNNGQWRWQEEEIQDNQIGVQVHSRGKTCRTIKAYSLRMRRPNDKISSLPSLLLLHRIITVYMKETKTNFSKRN